MNAGSGNRNLCGAGDLYQVVRRHKHLQTANSSGMHPVLQYPSSLCTIGVPYFISYLSKNLLDISGNPLDDQPVKR